MNSTYTKARIKLSLLYFFIIFCIVVIFSFIVIKTNDRQFARFDQMKSEAQKDYEKFGNLLRLKDFERLNTIVFDSKKDFFLHVVTLDVSILGLAIILSYYLSGKTMEPIINALDKQKKFVSDASHELRTPLTAIKTEAEVLARSKRTSLEEYKEFTNSLVEEVDKLNSLTENLLQIARLDNAITSSTVENIAISPFVNEIVAKFKTYAQIQEVELKFIPSETDISVTSDKLKLERLLSIIIDNAIKYNKTGGIVEVMISRDIDALSIVIKDTGIGISKEDQKKIFDRFYRASEARSDDGFGIGLAIAHELAHQIQAKIHLTSELGVGSTFEIILPV